MSSKRAQRRKACAGKVRHADQAGAAIALRKLRQAHGHMGQLSTYRCAHCGTWHLGHGPGANGIGSAWGRPKGARR